MYSLFRTIVLSGLLTFSSLLPLAALAQTSPSVTTSHQQEEELFAKGKKKFEQEDYHGAIRDYTIAIFINPNRSEFYVARGEARRRVGNFFLAIEDSNQALRLNRFDPDALTNRCAARIQVEDYQRALSDCNQSLKLNPEDADAYYNRGLVQHFLNQSSAALQDLQKAAELYQSRDDEAAYQFTQGAIAALEAGTLSPPDSARPQLPLAQPSGTGAAPDRSRKAPRVFRSVEPSTRGGSPTQGGETVNFAAPRGRGLPGRREAAGTR